MFSLEQTSAGAMRKAVPEVGMTLGRDERQLLRNTLRTGNVLRNLEGKDFLWRDMVNPDSRLKLINEMISKGLNQNNLETINGVLKSASIGIVPKENRPMNELRNNLLGAFVKESFENRKRMYGVFNSILKEIPNTHRKIMNRGPIRHGILGFKDHIIHGSDWGRLGPAGDFPRAVHQLSHQVPAPELGYICKAYAGYLRTGGNMAEFDRILRESGVSFEEYFVKNAKRIAGNGGNGNTWNQISWDKPKGVPQVTDEEIRTALSHRNWCNKNIDELMRRPEPKVATFFDAYGDTIIETLKGQGITLSNHRAELEKSLKPSLIKSIDELENLRGKLQDKNVDERWKENEGYPTVVAMATAIRKEIMPVLLSIKDEKKLSALLQLDNNLEGMVDTSGMNILSKAPKENGLMYKLDGRTAGLFLNLIENYALSNSRHDEEFRLLKRDLNETFSQREKAPRGWAESTLVPLNRLDRLISTISKDTSDVYRNIAIRLAESNSNDKHALGKVEQLADGILRGELLFPVSQINAGFKSHVRKLAGASPWQILSAGETAGKVVHAQNMEHLESIIKKNDLSKQNLICFVDTLAGAEEPPKGVMAIITPKVVDTLSHIGVRSRQENIVFACIDDFKLYEEIKKGYSSEKSYMNLKIQDGAKIDIAALTKAEYDALEANRSKVKPVKPVKVIIPEADLSTKECIIGTDRIKLSTSGPKATNIANLAKIVPIPESLDIPFGVFDRVLDAPENRRIKDEYGRLLDVVNRKQKENDLSVDEDCKRLKTLVNRLTIPKAVENEIMQKVRETMPAGTKYVMTRSSTNGEDLPDFSGAGLYSSQPNLIDKVLDGVKVVWAAKWNKRAFDARVKAEIPHEKLYVSVLIQPCIDTKYGFVTHTANPINNDRNQVFIELVQGQNEALVSGKIPGTGYGFLFDKKTGELTRTHLADKSYQFVPSDEGGTKIVLADYKNDKLAGEKRLWESTVRKIAEYSVEIEKLYKGVPQDIEGTIKTGDEKIYIVQTRDQLGLK